MNFAVLVRIFGTFCHQLTYTFGDSVNCFCADERRSCTLVFNFPLIIMKLITKTNHEDVALWKLGYSPFGKPKMYVHIFLIHGLLIDTGQSHLKKEIIKTLESKLPACARSYLSV